MRFLDNVQKQLQATDKHYDSKQYLTEHLDFKRIINAESFGNYINAK